MVISQRTETSTVTVRGSQKIPFKQFEGTKIITSNMRRFCDELHLCDDLLQLLYDYHLYSLSVYI